MRPGRGDALVVVERKGVKVTHRRVIRFCLSYFCWLIADYRGRGLDRRTTLLRRKRNFGARRLHFWGIESSTDGFAGCVACKCACSLFVVVGK